MGQKISRTKYTAADYRRFESRVRAQLQYLQGRLMDPQFGSQSFRTFGSEIETCLVDARGRPVFDNQTVLKVLRRHTDLAVVPELLRHQIEINGQVHTFRDMAFQSFEHEIRNALTLIASNQSSRRPRYLGLFGILPTLTEDEITPPYYSANPRFQVIDARLRELYGGYELSLKGAQESFTSHSDSVGLEGANTSLQIHLSVPTADFVRTYNAAQLATALALAVSVGSPYLFGHDLWAENRIPVFAAAVRGRAYLGTRWITSPIDPFIESLSLPYLIPLVTDEPDHNLRELCLAHHSVHPWNRAVVRPSGLGIEFRALPAGPTVSDMAANAALLTGLTLYLSEHIQTWINNHRLPFKLAHDNFLAAARYGLDAEFSWPGTYGISRRLAPELLLKLLPHAQKALVHEGIDAAETYHYFQIIRDRITSRQTTASWLRQTVASVPGPRQHALTVATARYLDPDHSNYGLGRPVSQWPAPYGT